MSDTKVEEKKSLQEQISQAESQYRIGQNITSLVTNLVSKKTPRFGSNFVKLSWKTAGSRFSRTPLSASAAIGAAVITAPSTDPLAGVVSTASTTPATGSAAAAAAAAAGSNQGGRGGRLGTRGRINRGYGRGGNRAPGGGGNFNRKRRFDSLQSNGATVNGTNQPFTSINTTSSTTSSAASRKAKKSRQFYVPPSQRSKTDTNSFEHINNTKRNNNAGSAGNIQAVGGYSAGQRTNWRRGLSARGSRGGRGRGLNRSRGSSRGRPRRFRGGPRRT